MKTALMAAAMAALLANMSHAQDAEPAQDGTGNGFYSACAGRMEMSPVDHYCIGYLKGLLRGWTEAMDFVTNFQRGRGEEVPWVTGSLAICPPDSSHAGQAIDIIMKYLRDYPEMRGGAIGGLSRIALSEAWPCP